MLTQCNLIFWYFTVPILVWNKLAQLLNKNLCLLYFTIFPSFFLNKGRGNYTYFYALLALVCVNHSKISNKYKYQITFCGLQSSVLRHPENFGYPSWYETVENYWFPIPGLDRQYRFPKIAKNYRNNPKHCWL